MWFAQETPPSPLEFVQYGALGLVVIGLILGWIWAKPAVDRLHKDKDRLIEERNQERKDRLELHNEIQKLSVEIARLREGLGRDRNVDK